jgi:ADP-ribose pyrophosphatase
MHTAIAYTDEAIALFLCRRMNKVGEPKLDSGEFLETLIVPFDEAIAMVRDGRITDSKSVCSLLWVEKWCRP